MGVYLALDASERGSHVLRTATREIGASTGALKHRVSHKADTLRAPLPHQADAPRCVTRRLDDAKAGAAHLDDVAFRVGQIGIGGVVIVGITQLAGLAGVLGQLDVGRMNHVAPADGLLERLHAAHVVTVPMRRRDVLGPHAVREVLGYLCARVPRIDDHALVLRDVDVAVGLDGTDDKHRNLVAPVALPVTPVVGLTPVMVAPTVAALVTLVVLIALMCPLACLSHASSSSSVGFCALPGHDAPTVEDRWDIAHQGEQGVQKRGVRDRYQVAHARHVSLHNPAHR